MQTIIANQLESFVVLDLNGSQSGQDLDAGNLSHSRLTLEFFLRVSGYYLTTSVGGSDPDNSTVLVFGCDSDDRFRVAFWVGDIGDALYAEDFGVRAEPSIASVERLDGLSNRLGT